ncbi:protealysin inhibitor emfourin [Planctomonas psychrotolerans]|uniref:protealysin inhibitor emfourin n=1 Tax=Planctomonas psychrotolerans TaxID=2528712 RepID=UPI001D0D27DE|nr:protealysin inhibitor emfourin [Planctomonas psychrotolerans]
MRIVVSRSGGFSGLTRRWVVDTDGPESSDWHLLVDACPWDEQVDDPPQPDRYFYIIVANAHEARLPEQQVEGPWRTLVDRVRSAGNPVPPTRPIDLPELDPPAVDRPSVDSPAADSPAVDPSVVERAERELPEDRAPVHGRRQEEARDGDQPRG